MSQGKVAFITGIAGQDGAYLAQFLLGRGYIVHGLVRWDSYITPTDGLARLDDLSISSDVILHSGDLTDAQNITAIIKKIQPNEIYNLASLSHVGVSFETPASTFDINTKGTLSILEAVRLLDMEDRVRIYQASSSEMFGSAPAPQNEQTPMHPCSPYGAAKLAAYWLARTYRESYNIHISNGILFNHESPLRGQDFVTHKITRGVSKISAGNDFVLELGNLNSVRDWGHSKDFVRGMWLMLQCDHPDDFVLATGMAKTVREFVEIAFSYIDIEVKWRGNGADEVGYNAQNNNILVRVNPKFYRPSEIDYLLGDASKAREVLGWKPEICLNDLIKELIDYDQGKLNV